MDVQIDVEQREQNEDEKEETAENEQIHGLQDEREGCHSSLFIWGTTSTKMPLSLSPFHRWMCDFVQLRDC